MATPNGTTDEGASPKERLFESCRRNNTDLLDELLSLAEFEDEKKLAEFLNGSTDALGNTAVHVAVQYGAYDVLDHLLDQEGLEVDPLDRLEKETPLHKAVKYANFKDKDVGEEIVELLLDAGADPRISNKGKQRPVDLVDPRNKSLKEKLTKAEYALANAGDVVDLDNDDDHHGAGSASDSE